MIREQMTGRERVEAAVRFEEVDRTPVTVSMSGPFVATATGLRLNDAYRMTARELVLREIDLWDSFGGWDGRYSNSGLHHPSHGYPFTSTFWAIKRVMPGEGISESADVQNIEQEIMREEEYDRIFELGWDEFWTRELVPRMYGSVDRSQLERNSAAFLNMFVDGAVAWAERGLWELVQSASVMDPPVLLATWRSAIPFMEDIHHQYDKVKRALTDFITPFFLDEYRHQIHQGLSKTNAPLAMVPIARYMPPFISTRFFEECVWPWMEGCVNIVLEEGASPMFHLDSDWNECFEYFLRFPKGKVVLHLGGESDIIRAKEVLKGHVCLMGDGSNSLMSLATPKEVTEYFRGLVDVVGRDNGFIMTSGCYLAGTARLENARAMVDVAKNYKPK